MLTLLIIYLIIGLVVAFLGHIAMRNANETAPIASYVMVVITWPLVLAIGFIKGLVDILMKEV